MKPGDFTHKPVQTQYGWHVIQLVDTRPLSPPPFDQVKQRLDQVVEAKKFKAYTDDLISKAKIDRTPAAPAAPAAAATTPAPKTGG
jgi:peptidyl-prolyl cis-trans isomerase C